MNHALTIYERREKEEIRICISSSYFDNALCLAVTAQDFIHLLIIGGLLPEQATVRGAHCQPLHLEQRPARVHNNNTRAVDVNVVGRNRRDPLRFRKKKERYCLRIFVGLRSFMPLRAAGLAAVLRFFPPLVTPPSSVSPSSPALVTR